MPAAKDQIRQIISENNITSAAPAKPHPSFCLYGLYPLQSPGKRENPEPGSL